MIARSLRAGHAISSAIQLVGTELDEPVGPLFKTAYEEQTLGLSMKDSLIQMLDRMPSVDLQLFVIAVNIHRDVGGNLSESVERLAHMIRERLKIRRQVRVYSAQARLSSIILLILPVFMAVFFYIFVPGYIEELVTSKAGNYGIAFAVIAQGLGFLVIRKIINIRI
jgi:tight adherence protein B